MIRLKYQIKEPFDFDPEQIIVKIIDQLRESNYCIVAHTRLNISFANHVDDLKIISRSESLNRITKGEFTIIKENAGLHILKLTYFISGSDEMFASLFIIAGGLFFDYWILFLLVAIVILFVYRVEKLKASMKKMFTNAQIR